MQYFRSENSCKKAGEFYILGDINEMEWNYDRLYKYEITHQLEEQNIHHNDQYDITVKVQALDGSDITEAANIPPPTVLFELGTSEYTVLIRKFRFQYFVLIQLSSNVYYPSTGNLYGKEYRPSVTTISNIRRNLNDLSEGEVESLRSAFLSIQQDGTYGDIAAFHGKPGLCEHDGHKIACCVHGMPTFPAWHRLYVEQVN